MTTNAPFNEPLLPSSSRFTGEKFLEMCSPCVYAWMRGDLWLYIGKSKCGSNRLSNHHVIKPDKVQPTDEFVIWRVSSELDALILEAKLIAARKPLLNTARAENRYLDYVAPKPKLPKRVAPRPTLEEIRARNEKSKARAAVIAAQRRAVLDARRFGEKPNVAPTYSILNTRVIGGSRNHAGGISSDESRYAGIPYPKPQPESVRRYFKSAREV